MKLGKKIYAFVIPYWKAIAVAILLTFVYVIFNNISLWVSVDFVSEIFSPEYITGHTSQSDSVQAETPVKTKNEKKGAYAIVKHAVRSVLIQDNRYDTLLAVCLVIFMSYLIKNIALYTKRVILNYVEINIITNIRNRLQQKMLRLPMSYLEKRHSGDLTSVVFNDVNSVKNVLHDSFGDLILSPVQVLANVLILIMISWELSLITFVVVPFSSFVIIKIGHAMRRRSRRVLTQIANVMSTFQEAITSVRIVKAFTNEEREVQKFRKTNHEWFKKLHRANKLKFATSPINEILLVLVLVFLLWYGGNLVYANKGLKADDFIRFLIFLFTMFQPIKQLAGINNVMQSGFAAAERIFDVIDQEEEVYEKPGAQKLETFKGKIEYSHVSFSYFNTDEYAVKDISFDVNKGEMIAFVGHSGSGKTTLINLLPRFYEVNSGQICLDGIDIRDFTLHSLRHQMSIVTQETILFNDTIRANIAYGLDQVSETDIVEAAKVANAWEFIQKASKGLDTHIGERGTRLSGGQKQRISIARAILKNPPILILDEATSSLDTESERLVQDAIDKLLKSRTVLVIAHRLSTITNADKIVVLNQGKVEAVGKHNELLQKSDTYRKLSQSQFIEA